MQHPAMSVVILRSCDSLYYTLPCFPVVEVTLTRVRMALISPNGEHGVAFDGFVRPSLLDGATLPQVVTPDVSFDIEVNLLFGYVWKLESRPWRLVYRWQV